MKRILLIHTGGTFGMNPIAPAKTLRPGKIEQDIIDHLPVLNEIAHMEFQIPFNLDSSNIGPAEWSAVYDIIAAKYNDFDGFVVIHGTDTLVYTATVMSYLFARNKKPIIFTGAQRPLSAIRSDARSNLINAVELATKDIPEVAVCFNNKLFRANRTRKLSIESYHGFESPNYPALATIGLNIQLRPQYFLTDPARIKLQAKFSRDILIISLYPGSDYKIYMDMLEHPLSSIVIAGFGAGNLPERDPNWIEFIRTAKNEGKTVYICSQSPHGTVDLNLYECGRKAMEAGALSLFDMTLEAAVVKLMLVNANYQDNQKRKTVMLNSLAGELTKPTESR
jgi:L-asparaginase